MVHFTFQLLFLRVRDTAANDLFTFLHSAVPYCSRCRHKISYSVAKKIQFEGCSLAESIISGMLVLNSYIISNSYSRSICLYQTALRQMGRDIVEWRVDSSNSPTANNTPVPSRKRFPLISLPGKSTKQFTTASEGCYTATTTCNGEMQRGSRLASSSESTTSFLVKSRSLETVKHAHTQAHARQLTMEETFDEEGNESSSPMVSSDNLSQERRDSFRDSLPRRPPTPLRRANILVNAISEEEGAQASTDAQSQAQTHARGHAPASVAASALASPRSHSVRQVFSRTASILSKRQGSELTSRSSINGSVRFFEGRKCANKKKRKTKTASVSLRRHVGSFKAECAGEYF